MKETINVLTILAIFVGVWFATGCEQQPPPAPVDTRDQLDFGDWKRVYACSGCSTVDEDYRSWREERAANHLCRACGAEGPLEPIKARELVFHGEHGRLDKVGFMTMNGAVSPADATERRRLARNEYRLPKESVNPLPASLTPRENPRSEVPEKGTGIAGVSALPGPASKGHQ